MKYCLLFVILLFSCNEMEEIKVPVGCECNKGRKLNFSQAIFAEYPTDYMIENQTENKMVPNHYMEDYCNATTLFVCGSTRFILDQGGVKRFIYDSSELD